MKKGKVGYKNELVFTHTLDNKEVKIINLGHGTFVWIQHTTNSKSQCDVEVMKQYSELEIRSMIEHFKPYNKDITALELFDKFLKQ